MLDTSTVKVGQIVTSIAGRDKGRQFIVIQIIDKVYVKVVDGDLRRIENPKLKKVKHLNVSRYVSDKIIQIHDARLKLTNEKIRKILEDFAFQTE